MALKHESKTALNQLYYRHYLSIDYCDGHFQCLFFSLPFHTPPFILSAYCHISLTLRWQHTNSLSRWMPQYFSTETRTTHKKRDRLFSLPTFPPNITLQNDLANLISEHSRTAMIKMPSGPRWASLGQDGRCLDCFPYCICNELCSLYSPLPPFKNKVISPLKGK